MKLAPFALAAALAVLPISSQAAPPRVATDVAPVYALTARVMDGVGSPDLILQQGASPHEYSLRPSEARALAQADLIFHVGAALTPWLEPAIAKLAPDAEALALLNAPGTEVLSFREGALFAPHDDHGHGADEAHDDQTSEGHGDHDADGEDGEPTGDHLAHEHDDHAHDGPDPHAWLAPENGKRWLAAIAEALSQADPENAAIYAANAAQGAAEIDAAADEIAARLAPLGALRFIVFHDAYQYFEHAFGLTAVGAISLGDASDPSPARLAEIRDEIAAHEIGCVFSEPQFNPGLVAAITDGDDVGSAVLDPMGSALPLDASFYTALLQSLADGFATCR